jgi:hypothetical protein
MILLMISWLSLPFSLHLHTVRQRPPVGKLRVVVAEGLALTSRGNLKGTTVSMNDVLSDVAPLNSHLNGVPVFSFELEPPAQHN